MILLNPHPTAIGFNLSGSLTSLCRPKTNELVYGLLIDGGRSLLIIVRSVCTVFVYGFEEFLLPVNVTMFLRTSERFPRGPAVRAFGVFEIMFMNLSIGISVLVCVSLILILVSCLFFMICYRVIIPVGFLLFLLCL